MTRKYMVYDPEVYGLRLVSIWFMTRKYMVYV